MSRLLSIHCLRPPASLTVLVLSVNIAGLDNVCAIAEVSNYSCLLHNGLLLLAQNLVFLSNFFILISCCCFLCQLCHKLCLLSFTCSRAFLISLFRLHVSCQKFLDLYYFLLFSLAFISLFFLIKYSLQSTH